MWRRSWSIAILSEGRLSATAVAASGNGKELGEMLLEGIACEVLSYKMELEEPGAAAIISSAMNIPQQLGMHTTELSAVAVLRRNHLADEQRSQPACCIQDSARSCAS